MAESPLKQRFVLDTSLFLTDEIRREDETLGEALRRLLDLIAEAKLSLNISCYMPPSIHEELTAMLRDRGVPDEVFSRLNTWVIRKSPAYLEVMVPAAIVSGFIEELSNRVDRGLRVAEDAVRRAEREAGDDDATAGPMSPTDRIVSELRDEYREALRQGVLDSREDFDLLVLARELEAGVVTEDTGITGWADDFGLRYMRGREFPTLLEQYLETVNGREDYRAG